MTWQDFFKSKIASVLLAIVLLFVMIVTAKILIQNYTVNKQISKLQTEMEKIRQDNSQLSYLIKYFGTTDYQEKQAREKLNLKKDGEYVVVLPNNDNATTSATDSSKNDSNYKKWFNYFFSKN